MQDVFEIASRLTEEGLQIPKSLARLAFDRTVDEDARLQIDGNDGRIQDAAGDHGGADLVNGLRANGFRRARSLFFELSHRCSEVARPPAQSAKNMPIGRGNIPWRRSNTLVNGGPIDFAS